VEGSVPGKVIDRRGLASQWRWLVSSRVARGLLALAIFVLAVATSEFVFSQQATSSGSQTSGAPESKSRLQDRAFQSKSLGRAMTYRILLPAGYSENAKKYPVLYLLHGWHGDYQNWSTLTKLTRYAEALPILVVMPDAGNSWYVDSATVPQDKFEQYMVHDLTQEVDEHWRTVRSARGRAIAGLSMGGYGAVKFALEYPETFGLAASLSGAFNAASPELGGERNDLRPSLATAFGAAHSKTRERNDLYALASAANVREIPYLYIDCGTQDDSFLEPNRKLAAILSQRKFAYEYHEFPGTHSWEYWDERLPAVLNLVRREMVEKSADLKTQ
jgi:putative tributyrin esterase